MTWWITPLRSPKADMKKNQPNHTLKNLAYICLKNMSHKATCMYSPSTPPPNHPLLHPLKTQQPQKHKKGKKERKEKKAKQFQNMIAIFNLIQCPVNQGHQWGWSKIHLITEKRGPLFIHVIMTHTNYYTWRRLGRKEVKALRRHRLEQQKMGQTKLHSVPTPDIKDGALDSSWFSVKETLRFIIIITGCFYIRLFHALEQTHCTPATCDSESVTVAFQSMF